jgi:hypothetical protein
MSAASPQTTTGDPPIPRGSIANVLPTETVEGKTIATEEEKDMMMRRSPVSYVAIVMI